MLRDTIESRLTNSKINVYEDISAQATGSIATFTTGQNYYGPSLRVFINGVFNNAVIIGKTSNTFTLNFTPNNGWIVETVYDIL